MAHLLLVTTNRFGVLARITSIVSSAGANIETAAAYPIEASDMSIVHLRINADSVLTERLRRKLSRLVDVAEVKVDEDHALLSIDLGRMTIATEPLRQPIPA
jgi:acetolactate synthase small subunit